MKFHGPNVFSKFLLNLFPKIEANAVVWIDIICKQM
jgi:hypothetical protein